MVSVTIWPFKLVMLLSFASVTDRPLLHLAARQQRHSMASRLLSRFDPSPAVAPIVALVWPYFLR